MNKRSLVSIIATLGAVIVVSVTPVQAGTTTGMFVVSATVELACSVQSTTNISFGSIQSPVLTNIDSAGSVTTRCTNGAAWSAALSAGNGVGATFARRKMTSGTNTLEYSLYIDGERANVWGDETAGTFMYHVPGAGAFGSGGIFLCPFLRVFLAGSPHPQERIMILLLLP